MSLANYIKEIVTVSDFPNQIEVKAELFNLLFIHNLIIIPIFARIYSLSESIKYNYFHLSRRFYDDNFQNDLDEHFKNKYYIRKFFYLKLFLVPLSIIFLIIIILLAFKGTRCSFYAFALTLYGKQIIDCYDGQTLNQDDVNFYTFNGCLMINIFLVIELCVFITLLTRVFRYPIKNDKFYLRCEFISIFIFWVLTHNILLGIGYNFELSLNCLTIFIANSSRNILLSIVFMTVTLMRKNISSEEIKTLMNDFESFMYCHVCFTFFKDYIKNYHEDDYKLLSFWIEYNIYKKQVNSLQNEVQQMYLVKNEKQERLLRTSSVLSKSFEKAPNLSSEEKQIVLQYEEQIKEMAECIFNDYFLMKNMSNTSRSKSNLMQIEFPVDVYEKVEESYKRNFDGDNLDEIFDEAFTCIQTKLYNLFLNFCRNDQEYNKLERIIFFIDFYEIKRLKEIPIIE